MFASTNVLTASPEFGATPSVATVNGAAAAEVERRGRVPGHLARRRDVNVIVH